MRSVFDILRGLLPSPSDDRARDIIQELWGEGYTFVRRSSDQYEVLGVKPPVGMTYQWSPTADLAKLADMGWQPVPNERHDGAFAPVGTLGNAEIGTLTLFERRKELTDAALEQRIAGAQKNVDDWIDRNARHGLMGHVRVGHDETAEPRVVGETKIPPELWPHISEIYAERDMLAEEPRDRFESEEDFRARITQAAIETIRARHAAPKQETAA